VRLRSLDEHNAVGVGDRALDHKRGSGEIYISPLQPAQFSPPAPSRGGNKHEASKVGIGPLCGPEQPTEFVDARWHDLSTPGRRRRRSFDRAAIDPTPPDRLVAGSGEDGVALRYRQRVQSRGEEPPVERVDIGS
jgi:hypothetical protein